MSAPASPIAVAFTPDANYAVHTGVALLSILLRTQQPARFHFYIIEGNTPLSAEIHRQYQQIVDAHGARISWPSCNTQCADDLPPSPTVPRVTSAMYYRLFLADLLPDIDQCLYLDGDMVALEDVATLWDATDLRGHSLGAVFYSKPIAPIAVNRYLNSGCLLLNLRYWREHALAAQCWALTRDPENLRFYPDQDILNLVCSATATLLDPRWNGTGARVEKHLWPPDVAPPASGIVTPAIAHFVGKEKPWHYSLRHPCAMEYWHVRARSPWRRAPWRVQMGFFSFWLRKNLCRVALRPRKGIYKVTLLGMRLLHVEPENPAG